ncbi:Putative peptidoglycan binding domain-containing protein [Lachnospiraceae bacterium NE2001]|nr:Putative peptidoglycan binding domain-containing protein [Lachnospiraceae bacterium NE2001]
MWSNKVIRYSVIGVISVLVLGYFAMVLVSLDTYYPGTKIDGVDYGFKSPLYVDNVLYKAPSNYNLEVRFRDGTETINGRSVGLSIDHLTELQAIKESQNPFLWFQCFWDEEYTLSDTVQFNESALDVIVDRYEELDPENMVDPENPTINVDEDGVVYALEGDQGNRIDDAEAVKEAIGEAIVNRESSVDIDELGLYALPEYSLDCRQVTGCVDYCNTIASLKITYKYGDYDIRLTPHQLISTIKISDDYSYVISKSKVEDMLESFSRLYDTYGSIRSFKTHNKTKVNISNGNYGWLLDVEKETDNLYSDIIHHTNVERTPAFLSEGFTYDETGDDIGDTYAEVDLTNQHMYYYKNGKLVLDTDVVTGCTNLRRGTPGGIYSIVYKQTPATLKGDDYETKVSYWMPFNGGIGFHDATWRGSFGGSIYIWSGSHGCVNMPYYKAQELFYEIDEGTPVILY